MTSARGRSLRSHLMWLYVLLAIFSGVVVPLLGMLLSHASFQEYQSCLLYTSDAADEL